MAMTMTMLIEDVDYVEMMITMATMAMVLTTRNREKAMGCCQPVSPIKSRSLWAFGNLPQNATDSHNYGKTVKCRWSCTETMKCNMFDRKNCSVFLDYRSASGADDFGGADDDRVKSDLSSNSYSSDGWSPLLRWWSLITLVMKIM